MVDPGSARHQEIDGFIEFCEQPYDDYIELTGSRAEEIARTYFAPLGTLTDETVSKVLGSMRQSIERHSTNRAIREWKGCCVGVAHYLLRPADLDGADRLASARALQRFSGWCHAGIPFWAKFQPVAEAISTRLFGAGVLRYLKIGEEWTLDESRLNREYMTDDGDMLLLTSPTGCRTGCGPTRNWSPKPVRSQADSSTSSASGATRSASGRKLARKSSRSSPGMTPGCCRTTTGSGIGTPSCAGPPRASSSIS